MDLGSMFCILPSQTGVRLYWYEIFAATERKSDRSEFILRPVSCKRKRRNVWRLIRAHAGLSSSRSHVNTPISFMLMVSYDINT